LGGPGFVVTRWFDQRGALFDLGEFTASPGLQTRADMNPTTGRWMAGYGLFLIAVGLIGFASNPEKAKTALLSGGTFGSLSILWGWLMLGGRRWAHWAACATAGFLLLVFCWRATVSWQAVIAGSDNKLVSATLITSMAAASGVMLGLLVARRPGSLRAAQA
jgi:uncharacterized membrane protein (UPF0136 family)